MRALGACISVGYAAFMLNQQGIAYGAFSQGDGSSCAVSSDESDGFSGLGKLSRKMSTSSWARSDASVESACLASSPASESGEFWVSLDSVSGSFVMCTRPNLYYRKRMLRSEAEVVCQTDGLLCPATR